MGLLLAYLKKLELLVCSRLTRRPAIISPEGEKEK